VGKVHKEDMHYQVHFVSSNFSMITAIISSLSGNKTPLPKSQNKSSQPGPPWNFRGVVEVAEVPGEDKQIVGKPVEVLDNEGWHKVGFLLHGHADALGTAANAAGHMAG
jgi:hypothetical protein